MRRPQYGLTSACSWLVPSSSKTDVKLGPGTCTSLLRVELQSIRHTIGYIMSDVILLPYLFMHISSNTTVELRPGTCTSHSHIVLQIMHHTLCETGQALALPIHILCYRSCIIHFVKRARHLHFPFTYCATGHASYAL